MFWYFREISTGINTYIYISNIMAIVPMVPPDKATKTNLDLQEAATVKSFMDREAVLSLRLTYIARYENKERAAIERAEVVAELKQIKAVLDFLLGVT